MPGSWDPSHLPNLNRQNHAVTSPTTRSYNCIAWAAGSDGRWWWPDPANMYYWPPNVPREVTIEAFIRAFQSIGYDECADAVLEEGFEKIALYARRMPWGDFEPTHAARQFPDGKWTSKLGPLEDITHTAEADVSGPFYGTSVKFLRRVKGS
jgi:hypothetical protein